MFYSYYGGLTCVCWSPDAKYILTGGQDDLISIWSIADSALVARCQGHQSWVASVAFDPWRCDERNYRFGSVGEDGRLCLWDFNVGMLHRPRAVSQTDWWRSIAPGERFRDVPCVLTLQLVCSTLFAIEVQFRRDTQRCKRQRRATRQHPACGLIPA